MEQMTHQISPLRSFPNGHNGNDKCPLPFRYPGGKHYALSILRPFWEQVIHDEYREPFVGGGSVFFAKPKVSLNWINDLDDELITTYKAMQGVESRLTLLERLGNEVASKERWREVFGY